MVDAIATAIYERIAADADIPGMLAASVIDDSEPAIYTTIPVPPGAVMPYIVAYAGDVAALNEDVIGGGEGGYLMRYRDVHVYGARPDDGGGDATTVEAIARRLRALFHRQPLVLTEGRNLSCSVTGPIINDGERAFGRVVSLALRTAETLGV